MSDDNSEKYHLARESQERALAEAATDPAIASIPTDMAARYSKLANQTAPKRPDKAEISVKM